MTIKTRSDSALAKEFIACIIGQLQSGEFTEYPGTKKHAFAKGVSEISPELLEAIVTYTVAMTVRDTLVPPDYTRVLRVVEYVGPRADVEKQISNSLHGTRRAYGASYVSAQTLGAGQLYWDRADFQLIRELAKLVAEEGEGKEQEWNHHPSTIPAPESFWSRARLWSRRQIARMRTILGI